MPCLKKFFILTAICIVLLCPQSACAGSAASNTTDKVIDCTAKTTYYVTKYTLKAGWFITKKTAKGIKEVSKSIFKATKDAFNSQKIVKPSNKDYIRNNSLPPPPPVLE